MNINIDTYWLYGYTQSSLCKVIYDSETGTSKILWLGKIYDHMWLATNNLYTDLNKAQDEVQTYPEVHTYGVGSENVIGIRLDANDELNHLPEKALLDEKKKVIMEVLKSIGAENLPEPSLYFVVKVE